MAKRSMKSKVVIVLIIACFLLTGITLGIKSSTEDSIIAEVGKKKITLKEFSAVYDSKLQHVSRLLNQRASPEIIKKINLHKMALNDLINMKFLDSMADDMKLDVGNSSVLDFIRNQPALSDKKGKFDKKKFSSILKQFNISEKEYKEEVKYDLIRNILVSALSSTPSIPDFLMNKLYNNQYQRRTVDIVKISNDAIHNVQNLVPSKQELERIYEENKDNLLTKEYRNTQYITIKNSDIKEEVVIDDKEVEEVLQDYLSTNQTYDLIQLRIPDKDTAESLSKVVRANNVDELLEQFKHKGVKRINLNMKHRSSLPREFRSIDFDSTNFSDIIELDGEYNILRVSKTYEADAESITKARQEIYERLKNEYLNNKLYKFVQKLERELVMGTSSFQELASAYSLTIKETGLIDSDGYTPEGKKADIPNEIFNDLTDNLFERSINETGVFLSSSEDCYYNLNVLEIVDKRVMSKDESAEALEMLWREKTNRYMLTKLAEEIKEQLSSGTSLNLLKSRHKIDIEEGITLYKREAALEMNPQQPYPIELIHSIFELENDNSVSSIYSNHTPKSTLLLGCYEI